MNAMRKPELLPTMTGSAHRRPLPSAMALARRRRLVLWAKRLLPVFALALLSAIALWPDIEGTHNAARITYHRVPGAAADTATMTGAHYQGIDQQGRPFTLTAVTAVQTDPNHVRLTRPEGDMTLQSDSWLMLKALHGLYRQRTQHLDLSGHVSLYRDDGTTMRTAAASIDMKNSTADGHAPISAEGPFGTLDAQGFKLVDHGTRVTFIGPAKLVLNGAGQ